MVLSGEELLMSDDASLALEGNLSKATSVNSVFRRETFFLWREFGKHAWKRETLSAFGDHVPFIVARNRFRVRGVDDFSAD
jgi:hypothetical protein